jgi:hypothetical protein
MTPNRQPVTIHSSAGHSNDDDHTSHGDVDIDHNSYADHSNHDRHTSQRGMDTHSPESQHWLQRR